MKKVYFVIILYCTLSFLMHGCAAVNFTGKAVGVAGKLAIATAKTTGKVIGKTAALTGKGVKTVVNMAAGRHVVKLDKRGNTLLVDTLLNRKVKAKLILDTGSTDTQISEDVAKSLGIKTSKGKTVLCQLADGRSVSGKEVNIKEIRLGRARVRNVRAIVLDSNQVNDEGLLGMSFLNNFIFKVDSEKGELILQKRI